MKKTLLVMSSNRNMDHRVYEAVVRATRVGAKFIHQRGSADVAYARCVALSSAAQFMIDHPDFDTALMVDDDIVFDVEHAQTVVDYARKTGRASSGAYGSHQGIITAVEWEGHRCTCCDKKLYLVGLGFLAIPRGQLLELYEHSERFEAWSGETRQFSPVRAFTWTGLDSRDAGDKREWFAEDYQLSKRLGGAHLLKVTVGHIKPMALIADLAASGIDD